MLLTALSAVFVRLMIRRGALDLPVGRSSHTVPTPKGGGVGIAIAYTVGIAWLLYTYTVPMNVLAPLCGGLLLALVSHFDDVRPQPFFLKLAAQATAAVLVVAAGDRLPAIAAGGITLHPSVLQGAGLSLGWLLFVTNAVNFMDGLNGLASGAILIADLALAVTAPASIGAQAVPLIAGIAGFLPFNYPRARIFMGDVGSQLCGFVTADLALREAGSPRMSLILPLALLPMLLDVGFTLLRRARAGDRLTEAHRGHLYQVAHRAGMNAAFISALYWAMTLAGALCGAAAGMSASGPAGFAVACAEAAAPFALWAILVARLAKKAGITRW